MIKWNSNGLSMLLEHERRTVENVWYDQGPRPVWISQGPITADASGNIWLASPLRDYLMGAVDEAPPVDPAKLPS